MKVIIVCGAPASGKTTYVRQHMGYGDFVVDLDAIKKAISFKDNRSWEADKFLSVALRLRKFLYRLIDEGAVDAVRCWIIECLPRQKDREELQDRFNAELIEIKATYDECVSRAMNDPERVDKNEQIYAIEKYIRQRNWKPID